MLQTQSSCLILHNWTLCSGAAELTNKHKTSGLFLRSIVIMTRGSGQNAYPSNRAHNQPAQKSESATTISICWLFKVGETAALQSIAITYIPLNYA
jgi:hypothetical protein